MANLKDLRNRIDSVKSTQKITQAMQMVAASKLRRAQDAAEAARPYAERMEQVSQVQTADRQAAKQVKELSAALKEVSERRDKLERQVDDLNGQLRQALDDCQSLIGDALSHSIVPGVAGDVADGLRAYAARHGFPRVQDLVGQLETGGR